MSISGPGESALPTTDRAKVSLTMIVNNEQENLQRCLASVEGIFDEIIVVDTGSTDRTKEIVREFGAKLFDFPWIDDFAAARNEALSHATGDYVFWLDADDVVEPAERVKLVALLAGLRRSDPSVGMVPGSAGSTPPGPPLGNSDFSGLIDYSVFRRRGHRAAFLRRITLIIYGVL